MTAGELRDRVALVTGAGSGIGLAVSTRFAQAGAVVVGLDRDPESRAAFTTAVGQDGAPSTFLTADVSDEYSVGAAVAAAEARHGRIDVLVTSAGVRGVGAALQMELAEWHRALDVNLTGTYTCARAVAPGMLQRGRGSVVTIASISGMRGFRNRVAYTASKHGVIGVTRALAAEFGARGVRVNAICPGLIDTPLTSAFTADPSVRQALRGLVPLGRMGRAAEIAEAALFLAGDGSSFITGVALPVDGGFTAAATYDVSGEPSAFDRPVSVAPATS
jgi:NAD(P)-dependent dehydrogenase (short-subunit alcohol dehydrogenase family)